MFTELNKKYYWVLQSERLIELMYLEYRPDTATYWWPSIASSTPAHTFTCYAFWNHSNSKRHPYMDSLFYRGGHWLPDKVSCPTRESAKGETNIKPWCVWIPLPYVFYFSDKSQ